MNDLLLGLGASLGLAGVSVGVLFLIYHQLLSMRIFPRLSRAQAFTLLFFTAAAVFSIAAMTIWLNRGDADDRARRALIGDYACGTPQRPSFPCAVEQDGGGRVVLRFAGPDLSESEMIDDYVGPVSLDAGSIRIELLNRFDADPHDETSPQLTASMLSLRRAGDTNFRGSWAFEGGPTFDFKMERAR